jgi:hydrogenase small subunit
MKKSRPTVYEEFRARGHSRRDFLKFCGTMAVALGLEASAAGQIAKALESNARPAVLWFHFQECTCCSESFIRSSHPLVADVLLDKISLDYTETLMAASGHQAEEALHHSMQEHFGDYIMLVEGSIPTDDEAYCCIGGRSALDIVHEAAEGAKAIIAWGNCASSGCVQAASPNPTGAKAVSKVLKGKTVINVQGCPPIAEVMTGVIVHILTYGRVPQLDGLNRPKAFYSRRVHDTCYRRPNYDAGLFVESWDDESAKKGYCLYKMGCRGPNTYNACGVMRWNNGVSFPIQSGHPCIGCSEANFWDNGPFYQHLPKFPGFGIEMTADRIGMIAGAVTITGIAAHAITTNIRKRRMIRHGSCDQEELTESNT